MRNLEMGKANGMMFCQGKDLELLTGVNWTQRTRKRVMQTHCVSYEQSDAQNLGGKNPPHSAGASQPQRDRWAQGKGCGLADASGDEINNRHSSWLVSIYTLARLIGGRNKKRERGRILHKQARAGRP